MNKIIFILEFFDDFFSSCVFLFTDNLDAYETLIVKDKFGYASLTYLKIYNTEEKRYIYEKNILGLKK